jgi:hypothetical protein
MRQTRRHDLTHGRPRTLPNAPCGAFTHSEGTDVTANVASLYGP